MDSNGHFNAGFNPYNQAAPPPSQSATPQPNAASFGSLSAQGHQQSQASSPHPTLPPLQAQNGGFSFGSLSYTQPGSQAQTTTSPQNQSMNSVGSHAYQHMSSNNPAGAMLPPSSFNQTYPQPHMYQASAATTLPPNTSTAGLPNIRPMPPGGMVGGPNGLPSMATTSHVSQIGQHPTFMQNEETPTHVVGSQGRRGILPSAPGRPNPPAQGSSSTKSMIPQKDADGKYPCPHCNKTYLHAKHLKRHLLRHTGDRPYMCHLCKDTFSRSDILKRHFQKCSLRRGNPTGANHLAGQRRNTNNNRLSITTQEGPIGLANMPEVAGQSNFGNGVASNSPTINGDMSARSSRANSIITPATMSHRNSLAGLGILGSNASSSEQVGTSASYQPGMNAYAMQQHSANGAAMPGNYPFNGAQQMNGNMFNSASNQSQPMSFLGHQSSRFDNSQRNSPHQMQSGDGSGPNIDWTRMFSQSGQDGFIDSHPANVSSQGNIQIKTEHENKDEFHNQQQQPQHYNNDSFLGSLYSHPSGFGGEETEQGVPSFPTWRVDDPFQAKSDLLMSHCFPGGADSIQSNPAAELMKMCLQPENVKHFAAHYTSYHGHWPILHMPTFKLSEASNNLVLTILCVGAIYSPNLNMHQARQLMEFVKDTVFASSPLCNRLTHGQTQGLGNAAWEIEELQALSMLQTIFTWHGDPVQRQAARGEFPTLAQITKNMGLLFPASPSHYAYSQLHSSRTSQPFHFDRSNWNWHGWLEQEKRNRVLYQVFLTDAALVMYFNCTPQFDSLDIRLMLPADDAAWDAGSAQDCASALGLNGPQAQSGNTTGTRKASQPSMRDAMRGLLEPHASIQLGTTNVYSKFLLIHALTLRVIACQKAALQPEIPFQGFTNFSGSTPATPLSQNDWLDQHGSGSGHNSGRVTPTEGSMNGAIPQEKKRLGQALEKWKRNWDNDMELQYPFQAIQQRRFGFVRDGVHFFFLARSFLQSQQATDWTHPADLRFKRVMSLLKRIKATVMGDSEHKGHDIGSVGDIDDQYGADSLTLDMKLLFRPYNSQLDSPIAGVQTHV